MERLVDLSHIRVAVKGGGDIGSGVAWRLHQCGLKVFVTEIPAPLAVRRTVSFCEAVYEGTIRVQGVEGVRVADSEELFPAWERGQIPVLVDPACEVRHALDPGVLIDATLAKKNLGTSIHDAPLVIALGPGFQVGTDAHYVVETNRGHNLGRLLTRGSADPNTGIPGPVLGVTTDRVLRSPLEGLWRSQKAIGDRVTAGEVVGRVSETPVPALIDGVIRGLIRPEISVPKGLKIGDIDPRGQAEFCYTISEKALAIAGGVLEGIFRGPRRSS